MFNNKEFKDISLLSNKKDFKPYNYIWFVNNRYLISSNHYQLFILDTVYKLDIKEVSKIKYKSIKVKFFNKDMQEVVCKESIPEFISVLEPFVNVENNKEYIVKNWNDIKDIALINKYTGEDYYIPTETICLFNKIKVLKNFDNVCIPKQDGLVALYNNNTIFLTVLAMLKW